MAKGSGCDCGSFLYILYGQFGLKMDPFPLEYPSDWCLHKDDERYINFLTPYTTETNDVGPGDLVVFQFGRAYSHGAIITERKTVIHSWGRTGVGQVMESGWNFFNFPGGKPRLRKYYQVPI